MLASSNDVSEIAPTNDPVRDALRIERAKAWREARDSGHQLDIRMIPYNTNETQGGFRNARLQLAGYV